MYMVSLQSNKNLALSRDDNEFYESLIDAQEEASADARDNLCPRFLFEVTATLKYSYTPRTVVEEVMHDSSK